MKRKGVLILLMGIPFFSLKAQVPKFPGAKVFEFSDSIVFQSAIFSKGIPAPGVYTLPRDHMPCLVPETSQIAPMPNFWTGNSDALKNAPGILSPSKLLSIQFTAFSQTVITKALNKKP